MRERRCGVGSATGLAIPIGGGSCYFHSSAALARGKSLWDNSSRFGNNRSDPIFPKRKIEGSR